MNTLMAFLLGICVTIAAAVTAVLIRHKDELLAEWRR